ncbi:MAG: ABC transporter permease [Actinobacteria bacterium RBG_16_64_13]|nr:MAG: ABC transporter permease [Actinobacteria bacterium RBG_16_64_13]
MDEVFVIGEPETLVAPAVSDWRRFLKILFQRKLVVVGTFVLVCLVLVAIFAPLIAPYDPVKIDMGHTLQSSSGTHLLGTDNLGRDVFSRLVYGSRTALIVGLGTVAFSAVIGIILGILAGFLGGWINAVIMRIMDALMGFPMMVLALLLAAVMGAGMKNIIIALGIATLPGYTRLMCAATLSVRENEYILAQRAIGAKSLRTMVRHVLPNAIQPMIVLITTMLGNIVLAEAGLSFLGIGVNPSTTAAWGSMAVGGFRFLGEHPLLSFAPCIAIAVVVFAFNMLGDGLRDALDPRLRGKL